MMTNYKKLYKLIHLTQLALNTDHYNRAEKLFRQLLQEAFESNDNKIIGVVSVAFLKCRRLHALNALKIIRSIDPIQAKRKELS